MPVQVNGVEYLSVAEVLADIGVTRQTLWRWRQEGHIPGGNRYRGRQVVFSPDELAQIRSYANRVEPIEVQPGDQLSLFDRDPGS